MPPANNPQVGRAIRARRDELGFSLRGLAERAAIDPGFLSRIENEHTVPGTQVLMALAAALQTSVGELVGDPQAIAPLPELPIYLRAKYDLSDEAISHIHGYLAGLGAEPGPTDGEDEAQESN